MEQPPMNGTETFGDLLDRIKDGGDEHWDYFDAHLNEHLQDLNFLKWAYNTALSDERNEHYRDAAATVLAHTEIALTEDDQTKLADKMASDSSPFVRYWLANALYKRGNRDSRVAALWEEACQQNNIPAGEFARQLAA